MNASGLNAVMEQDEIDDLAKELEEVTVGKAEENALRLREAAADNARKLKQEQTSEKPEVKDRSVVKLLAGKADRDRKRDFFRARMLRSSRKR
ncbi:hypothetical protein LTS08_007828 [Lithohypha guttulata]|nr:hypothetical protein LTS08_007828 [Lithohypha guttulata]